MSKTHEFRVGMTCGGCESAITRILGRLEGVESFQTDVPSQKVTVTGPVDHQLVLAKLTKWGTASNKTVEYVGEL